MTAVNLEDSKNAIVAPPIDLEDNVRNTDVLS